MLSAPTEETGALTEIERVGGIACAIKWDVETKRWRGDLSAFVSRRSPFLVAIPSLLCFILKIVHIGDGCEN